MKITILTIFPNLFQTLTENTIIKRAIVNNLVDLNIVNIRDYTKDKYKRVDTPPIGGGSGLIMKCQPIVDALRSNSTNKTLKILLSPKGKTYNQKDALRLSKQDEIILICGNYEGIDDRISNYVDEIISIGDYILTGGEIAAIAIANSIIRLIPHSINNESIIDETFENNLLEYPQYTEPINFEGHLVPEVLLCGNHEIINRYRYKMSLKLTKKYRPDLFNKLNLTKDDLDLLKEDDISEIELKAINNNKKK